MTLVPDKRAGLLATQPKNKPSKLFLSEIVLIDVSVSLLFSKKSAENIKLEQPVEAR